MSTLRRRDQAQSSQPPGEINLACDLAVAYPCLWEHLSVAKYPDGTLRVLSTLTLFCDAGTVKLCLNDRDQGLTAWASGGSWRACLLALEAGLANDTLEWRQPPSRGRKKG